MLEVWKRVRRNFRLGLKTPSASRSKERAFSFLRGRTKKERDKGNGPLTLNSPLLRAWSGLLFHSRHDGVTLDNIPGVLVVDDPLAPLLVRGELALSNYGRLLRSLSRAVRTCPRSVASRAVDLLLIRLRMVLDMVGVAVVWSPDGSRLPVLGVLAEDRVLSLVLVSLALTVALAGTGFLSMTVGGRRDGTVRVRVDRPPG